MQNGLDQKAQGVPNEDFESSYMHTANVNQVTVSLKLGLLVFSWTDSAKIEISGSYIYTANVDNVSLSLTL